MEERQRRTKREDNRKSQIIFQKKCVAVCNRTQFETAKPYIQQAREHLSKAADPLVPHCAQLRMTCNAEIEIGLRY